VDAEAVGRVRRLRAVDEAPLRPAGELLAQAGEDLLGLPPLEDLALERRVVRHGRQRVERLVHGWILGWTLATTPGPPTYV